MKTINLIASALMLAVVTSCSNNKTNDKKASVDSADNSLRHETIIQSVPNFEEGKPVCIDFYAEWCPPCQQMKPIFHELGNKYGDKIQFVSANTDEYPELAHSYGIEAIPTFVFLNADHQETGRITGACPAEDLQSELNKLIKK